MAGRIVRVSVKKIPAPTAQDLIRPVWMRGLITLAFAIFTTFWQDDTLTLLKISLAAFFVLGATAVWDYAKLEVVPDSLRGMLAVGASVWVLSGVAAVFVGGNTAAAVVAAVGFLGMGVAELVGGLRSREEFVPARDHIILGAVGTITGVSLMVGSQLDPHGILGISGMGVIVMAVLLLISGGGLVHDSKKS